MTIPNHEVFIIMSGHGAQIPTINPKSQITMDNGLIFTAPDGLSRRYLRDQQLFGMLFGQVDVTPLGIMSIPVTTRQVRRNKDETPYYAYSEETISFHVTPGIFGRSRQPVVGEVPRPSAVVAYTPMGKHAKYVKDRGLPPFSKMLSIFDTCHATSMTNLPFLYQEGRMVSTARSSSGIVFPLCVCLSATGDDEEAPSTSIGSPFTRHMYNIFSQLSAPVSIAELHRLMYTRLPTLLSKCGPTITSTSSTATCMVPLLGRDQSRTTPRITPDMLVTYASPRAPTPRRLGVGSFSFAASPRAVPSKVQPTTGPGYRSSRDQQHLISR